MMPPRHRRVASRRRSLARRIGALPFVIGAGCEMMPSRSAPEGEPHGVAPEAWVKFDAPLRAALRDADANAVVPVLVVLAEPDEPNAPPPETRPTKETRRRVAVARQRAFQDETAALVAEVEQAGAREIALHWINRTVAMVAPRAALEAAGRRPEVRAIVRSTAHDAIPE